MPRIAHHRSIIIGSDLSRLVETLQAARRCRRTILQNFTGTLVVDGIGAGLISRLFLGFFVNPVLYEMVARDGDVLQV